MRKILVAFTVVVALIIGCKDSLINPEVVKQNDNNQKSWITLPQNPQMSVETDYTASKQIDGETGGSVELKINYVTRNSVNVIIEAEIDVPAGAYSGEKNITMIINSWNGTATFYPSPETFNKPLVFNLQVSGVNLNGIDPKSIDYVYLAPDGSFDRIQYKQLIVNGGILRVVDAQIPHFSIYG
ncbi:MAG: hypothetical protein P8Z35_18235, partial [Ignavibacteriaceae bacterium]